MRKRSIFIFFPLCKALLTGQTFKAMTLHCWRKKVFLTLCGRLILSIHTFDLWHHHMQRFWIQYAGVTRAFPSQTSQHVMAEHKVVFLQLLLFLHKQYCIYPQSFRWLDVFFSLAY